MNTLVVDASIAAAWLLEDEDGLGTNEVAERLEEDQALVPNLWHAEIRNAFLVAERRGRLSRRAVDERLGLLNALPVRTDYDPDLQSAFDLARTHSLTIYDAIYLELAMRRNAVLATLDRDLGRAAVAEGLVLAP